MSTLNKNGTLKKEKLDDLSTIPIAEETKVDLGKIEEEERESGKISSSQGEDNVILVNLQTSTLEDAQETPDTQESKSIRSEDDEVIVNPLASTSVEGVNSKVGGNSPDLNAVSGMKEDSSLKVEPDKAKPSATSVSTITNPLVQDPVSERDKTTDNGEEGIAGSRGGDEASSQEDENITKL